MIQRAYLDPRFQKSVFTQLVKKRGSQHRDAPESSISQPELNYVLQDERRSNSPQTLSCIMGAVTEQKILSKLRTGVKENYLRFAGYPRRLVVTGMGLKWAGGGAA